jgi:hypothetical protein
MTAFVRGPFEVHFEDRAEAVEALKNAGFRDATVRGSKSRFVRIGDART